MKLLIFAHTPPPVHGQSVMVATLVEGLRGDEEIEVLHVDVRLSHSAADIGRWRPRKVIATLGACLKAWQLRLRHGPAVFYYVPAPGKRGALYRDLLVMAFCRPFFRVLVLHWHAVGLGEWLQSKASAPERWLAQRLLGEANLAIVLAPELKSDAAKLFPRKFAVVANCAPDPGPCAMRHRPHAKDQLMVLFLGTCSREKGLFDTIEAIRLVHQADGSNISLTIAGSFLDPESEQEFHAKFSQLPAGLVQYVGFANESKKKALLASSDVVCLPSFYPHEGQPLVIIEALAHDLPVIATRWRALPGMLPPSGTHLVDRQKPEQIATALRKLRDAPPPAGEMRSHYLANFTQTRHIQVMKTALLQFDL